MYIAVLSAKNPRGSSSLVDSPGRQSAPVAVAAIKDDIMRVALTLRIPPASDMYQMSRAVSTYTSYGLLIVAEVAADPSPVEDAVPLPTTVDMCPVAFTNRTLLFSWSTMRNPCVVTTALIGLLNVADVASPPSPV
jgi:hypothetical protein